MRSVHRASFRRALATIATAVVASSCTVVTEDDDARPDQAADDAATPSEVVLVTHESFALPKRLKRQFEEASGFTLDIRSVGDAGTLTNRLVLTKDSPIGDVAFGVDNTFASRALEAGVFADSDVPLPAGADAYSLDDGTDRLVPVDTGNVCVNIDTTWFEEHGIPEPETLDDLVDPAYQDLFVTPGAATSSPGMAFLLSTIAEYGDDWPDYWSDLMANGARLTSGWSDAYFVDFTQGGGEGDRPIVVSYDSSPAFTLTDDGTETTTKALLDTCFEQVEYAGVLEGADNPEGGEALVEFLLSSDVQAALPESMYVFPVADGVELPPDWARFAVRPDDPHTVDPEEITEHREEWLTTWTDVTSR
jgi:thiamine transport system substrate-binding protein